MTSITTTAIVTIIFDLKDCSLIAICLFATEYHISLWMVYPAFLYQIFIRLDDRRDTLPEKKVSHVGAIMSHVCEGTTVGYGSSPRAFVSG